MAVCEMPMEIRKSGKNNVAQGAVTDGCFPELNFYATENSRPEWRMIADHYVAHEFNLLGSGWVRVHFGMQTRGFETVNYSDPEVTAEAVLVDMSEMQKQERSRLLGLAKQLLAGYEPIDWFIDFKSGYRYPLKHFSEIRYGLVEGVDAKVPYDLSRCCHLTVLARAWQETGQERYRREVMAQMMDWMSANPVEYGIGWHANMNVGIRLANWIVAYSIIRQGRIEGDELEAAFAREFTASLVAHREFVSGNLEFAETSIHPNHYLADLGGLLVGSSYLSMHSVEHRNWARMALREIQLELDRQVGADGFDYEAATNYHAFALEMIVLPLIIAAKLAGHNRPAEIVSWLEQNMGVERTAKLRRMFQALRDLIQPNHRIPLIGDIDNGRFFYLETPGHHECDWRFLCCMGATLFEQESLWPDEYAAAESSLAQSLFLEPEIALPSRPPKPISSAFPDAGFYLMKTTSVYSAIFAGPIGTDGGGGHAHDDKLSFTFSLGKYDFLVDPGIYTYTPSKHYRDLYRSCAVHNTVCVDGQPQNCILEDSPWWGCHEETKCEVLAWEVSEEQVIFEGQHQGYLRLPSRITHRRRIALSESHRVYEVRDYFSSETESDPLPKMCFHLMLHPDCEMASRESGRLVVRQRGINLKIEAFEGEWKCSEAFVSPSYGVKCATTRLTLLRDPGVGENLIRLSW